MASIRRVIVDEVRDNPLARGPIADTSGAKRLVLGPALRVPGDNQYATQAVTEAVTEAASAMTSNLRPSEGGPRTGNHQDDPATTVDTSPEASGDDIYNMPVDNADAQDEPAPDNTSKKRRELVRGRRKEAPAVAEPSPQAPPQAPVSEVSPPVLPAPTARSPAVSERREGASNLEVKIAALETLVARSKGQWEPDRPEQDAYAAGPDTPMTWDSSNAEPATPISAERQSPPTEQPKAEMDEAKFRQFVVEIVREELKVQLDIRLTRLVRNIVGREVKRALDKDDIS